jgi:16S rRNA (guanine527-N7)-methyltransferase
MKNEEIFRKGLKELNIPCSDRRINAFMSYLTELKKWNKTYNLTALRNDNDIIVKHFLDSLLYLKTLPEGILKLADAGAGAGFPGIPLKLVRPELDLALIDSSRKKAAFLRHIVRHLQLKKVSVLEERLERLGKKYEKSYDIIVTRAAFSIKDFLRTACPYVKKDGKLILSKGPKLSEELNGSPDNERAVLKILKARLPFEEARRNLVVLNCRRTSGVGRRT